ncbi:spore protease YyaC [Alkalibacillus silvisoli]|uniref:Spore protease YyaC n=1 Tax=Alkalibacillus silvisoli TaxID=392823 RepID=A0ABP3JZW9_9BACI
MSNLTNDCPSSFHCEERLVSWKIANVLEDALPKNYNEIILLFIGTDRSTGDSFGPLTGTLLQAKLIKHFHIFGTLKEPVHAKNIQSSLTYINKHHNNPFIIAIDAALGQTDQIKTFKIGNGGLEPGAAFNKQIPPVGDLNVKGFVNTGGFLQLAVLQSTRLSHIMEMSETFAQAISLLDSRLKRKNKLKVTSLNDKSFLTKTEV